MENFSKTPQKLEMFEHKMLSRLEWKANQINNAYSLSMEPFIELYGMDTVKNDSSKVANKMRGFEKNIEGAEALGPIFEAAFLDIGNRGQWFGPHSEIVRASKYDDIENGVDMIVTNENPENGARHLAVASDLTFSFPRMSEKFGRIIKDAQSGNLAEIKYFNSKLLHFTGRQSNVPRTVVGLEAKNLNKMLINWLREPELTQLQYGAIIMQQIAAQCSALAKVAGSKQKSASIAYQRAADLAHIILRTNYKEIDVPEDKISNNIIEQSAKLKADFS